MLQRTHLTFSHARALLAVHAGLKQRSHQMVSDAVKVLHFFKTYRPDSFGGVERSIHALATGCVAKGMDIDVLSLSPNPSPDPQMIDGHRVIRAQRTANIASTGLSLGAIKLFRNAAKDADLIHYHYPWPFMDLIHFITAPGKPSVVTYHSDIVRQSILDVAYAPLRHRFLSSVNAIVATSPAYLKSSKVLNAFAAKTTVIPLGLDASHYEAPDDAKLKYWKSRFQKPFSLFIGEFRYYKGLETLLEAAPHVASDIVVLGAGPLDSKLRKIAESRKLNNVHFVGRLDDLDKVALIMLSNGVVLPSNQRSEAFGLVTLEAAIHATPIISCEIGTGTSYVNINGETGIVVPPSDPLALAGALNQIAACSITQDRMGRAARNRFEQKFTAQRMVDSYVDLYQTLVH
jgi:glycosyltransferase involved in cell wall biosynthesis